MIFLVSFIPAPAGAERSVMVICKKEFWEGDNFAGFLGFLVRKKDYDVLNIIDVVEKPYKWEKEFGEYMKDLPNADKFYLESGGMGWDERFYSGLDGHGENCFGPFSEATLYDWEKDAHGANALILKEEGFECYIGQLDRDGCFDGEKVWSPGDKR